MAGIADSKPHPRLPVRASDAERDQVVAALRERFAAGALSQHTFVGRMEAALGARDLNELAGLLADLPPPRRRRGPARAGLDRLTAAATALLDAMAIPARRGRPPAGLIFPAGGRTRFTIGRSPDCDLVIPDTSVSRWHAGLDRVVGGWLLTDLGSTNGTRVNGWRVRDPVPVRPGDQVSFGTVTFVLQAGPPGRPAG